jgi:hypothetical protein
LSEEASATLFCLHFQCRIKLCYIDMCPVVPFSKVNGGTPVFSVNRDSVAHIATGYGMDDRGVGVRVPVGSEFSVPCIIQTGSGPTQPPIQWVPGALSPGQSGWGVKLTTHLQLVPRSRKCGSVRPLPHTPSCCSA